MRKLYSLLWTLLCTTTLLWAQNPVTGKVTDENGNPVAGATIAIKRTSTATVSDVRGDFSINAPQKSTLVISHVSFGSTEVVVNSSILSIQLKTDESSLSEVVVTGYGTKIKRDVTGSMGRVSGSDIENTPIPSIDAAIQGKAAGVFVNSGSGKLGQGITVRVRGNSSISASSQPLYVLDGVPITTASQSSYGGTTNPLVDINPNDIESIDILKDASAGAIYGSRAANGVVLITTKKGKTGKTNVSANVQKGYSEATKRVEFLNAQQYIDFYRQAAGYRDRVAGTPPADPNSWTTYINDFYNYHSFGTAGTPNQKDYNWQDQAFQKGGYTQADVQLNGGNDKTRFFLSGQYLVQEGTIIGNNLDRITGRLNLDHKATNWLSVGLTMSLARTMNRRLPDDNAFSNPLQMAALPPITPFTDPNTGLPTGTPPGDGDLPLYYNPVISVNYAKYIQESFRNFSTVYGQVNILPGLRFRSEFGVDLLSQNEEGYFQSQTVRNQTRAANGVGINRGTFITNYNTNNFFTYDKSVKNHTVEATLGMSYQQSQAKYNFVEGLQFPSNSYQRIASAATKSDGSSSETNFRFLSYFLRTNYKFNDKYLLSVSGRIDGSSRFGANSRYGFFPAVSLGWILSEEKFLENARFVSFLKLRGSYGIVGNSEIGNFPQLGLFSGDAGYAGSAGQRPSQIGNPDLKWEQTKQLDLGLDFGFFNNRITGELDYYTKNTTGLLLNVNVPATTGFTSQVKNVGRLENRGVELVINSKNVVGKFNWSTQFNIATNKNKVLDIQGQIIEGGVRSMNRVAEGQPIGVFFTVEYAGVNPANGDALFYSNTKNADGTINRATVTNAGYGTAQRVVVGNPNPKYIGGITNTFSYKGFDLNVFFNGVYGNQINIYGIGQYSSANAIYEDNQTVDQLKAWTLANPNTNIPEARFYRGNGNQPSSRYIVNGSYLRLRSATLGYNLPSSVLGKIKVSRVRVYVSALNLLTITNYPLWDPEVNADSFTNNYSIGNDFYTPPQPKTILFGFNIGL
ncbi:MAG: TonB-dependent receptor [Bacteroidota bacterium]